MAVETEINRIDGLGNGVTTEFPSAPMTIYSADQVRLVIADPDGNETEVPQGAGSTEFAVLGTLPGNVPNVFTVKYPASGGTPLPAGWRYVILRIVDLTQPTSLENQGGYHPKVQEGAFDRLTYIAQQLQEQIDRKVGVDLTSNIPPDQLVDELLQARDDAQTAAQEAADDAMQTAMDVLSTAQNVSDAQNAADAAAQSALDAQVAKVEWQGQWVAGTYQINDAVEHNGSSWIATAVTTEEPSLIATEWDLMAQAGAGLNDGNKGDITVGSAGTVFTINDEAVTNAKLADMPALTIKGRGGVAGAPVDLTATQGRAVLGLGSAALLTAGSAAGNLVPLDSDSQVPMANARRMESATITLGGSSAVDITGIPPWAKKITVWWRGVDEGAEAVFIRGITASGVVTGAVYNSSVMGTGPTNLSGAVVENMNNGLRIGTNSYAGWSGCGTLIKQAGNNAWHFGFSSSNTNGGVGVGGGFMNAGEVLTGLRFQVTGGSTFTTGTASIMVEG